MNSEVRNRWLQLSGALAFGFLLLFSSLSAQAKAWQVPPDKVLEQLSGQMLDTIRKEQTTLEKDPEHLFALVDGVLGPHVDFPLVSRLVLGKYWRTATPEQREQFTKQFRQLLVRFYVSALLDDPKQIDKLLAQGDKLIKFQPSDITPDDINVTVRSEVHLPSGQVVPVTFNVHHKTDEWKIYDVNVEGISLIHNYRSSFSSEVRQKGLDGLISQLAARNKELVEKGSTKKMAK